MMQKYFVFAYEKVVAFLSKSYLSKEGTDDKKALICLYSMEFEYDTCK